MLTDEERERRLALLAEDEDEGDVVEVAPPRPSSSVVVSVRMPAEMADVLATRAQEEGKATGTYCRELLEQGLALSGKPTIHALASAMLRVAHEREPLPDSPAFRLAPSRRLPGMWHRLGPDTAAINIECLGYTNVAVTGTPGSGKSWAPFIVESTSTYEVRPVDEGVDEGQVTA